MILKKKILSYGTFSSFTRWCLRKFITTFCFLQIWLFLGSKTKVRNLKKQNKSFQKFPIFSNAQCQKFEIFELAILKKSLNSNITNIWKQSMQFQHFSEKFKYQEIKNVGLSPKKINHYVIINNTLFRCDCLDF